PRNPIEGIVAAIWSEVLGLNEVGMLDNFFELGGHSLLATQVIARLHKALQIEIPLRNLFEAPTVAGLAEKIEEERLSGQGLHLPPLLPVSRQTNLPISSVQEWWWFLDQLDPNNGAYNIPAN